MGLIWLLGFCCGRVTVATFVSIMCTPQVNELADEASRKAWVTEADLAAIVEVSALIPSDPRESFII